MKVSIIGFGEAGPVIGKALSDAGMTVSAYDRLQDDSNHRVQQCKKTRALGITPAGSITEAVTNTDLVISTVTASEAVNAATQASPGLSSRVHWLDLNSVAPHTKTQIHEIVTTHGATFTEAVAMDTVPAKGIKVPILLSGPTSKQWSETLNAAGMNTRSVSTNYGTASTTKLIRSVIVKGFESLFAEAMEAAGKVGVQDDVLASLQATYPGLDWEKTAGYQLSRTSLHAKRRAAEMRESAAMLETMGVKPIMATAIAEKQQDLADREIGRQYRAKHPGDNRVSDFIAAIQT